ncbi:hypothetical protein VARIO8X_130161 [Burkholderiales bacterium 8X]|nr:hypothetical protein VARIO8X_130161 [Burkholderiales bacterium 8X]
MLIRFDFSYKMYIDPDVLCMWQDMEAVYLRQKYLGKCVSMLIHAQGERRTSTAPLPEANFCGDALTGSEVLNISLAFR